MRALLCTSLFLFLFTSCIPTKIAPAIEDYKVTVAKKFKKGLPKTHAFVFEDPKNANEFYSYVNNKFNRNDTNVYWNVPAVIGDNTYYLSFYEVERTSKAINIAPIIADIALVAISETSVNAFHDLYISRDGKWYVVLTVDDEAFNDSLDSNYAKRYLSTTNYTSLLFKK